MPPAQTTPEQPEQVNKTESNKALKDIARQYLLPVVLFGVSIFLVVGVILPLLQDVSDNISQIQNLQTQYSDLLSQKTAREALNSETNQQESILTKIDKLIPESQTDVTGFRQLVGTKSQAKQLTLSESVVGEVVVTSTNVGQSGKANTSGLDLIEIPAEFTITGNIQGIRDFLASLFGGSDFVIIKKMDLQKQLTNTKDTNAAKFSASTTNVWTMDLVLTKYQFKLSPGATADTVKQYYFSISDTQRANRAVLDFIDQNYQ